MNNSKKLPMGKIIAIIIILIVATAVFAPSALFFLSETQQEALTEFHTVYFKGRNPLSSSDVGFDILSLVSVAILIGVVWIVNSLVSLFSKNVILTNRHSETIKALVCNCIRYAVIIYAILFGLSMIGIDMVPVLASLGILALVVGFGAQTLIEDVITGFFIIFEGQFKVGDIITIDGFRGSVSSIGIRTTSLTDFGGNIKVVNNSDIRTLINLSSVDSVAVTVIGISYNASIPEAEEVVHKLFDALPTMYPEVFKVAPEYLGVETVNSSSIDLKMMAKVDEQNIYSARRIMNRELKLAFDEANIEIPFPQVVVHQAK